MFESLISEEHAEESSSRIIRQHPVTNMDDRPTYFEDFHSCAFHLDRRNQDDFLQLSSMQDQLHSPEMQFFGPTDPVQVRVTEDSAIAKRHSVHPQAKEHETGRRDLKELNWPRESYGTPQNLASMASVLQHSRYLKPAQELLDEIVSVRSAAEPSSDEEFRRIRSAGMTNRAGRKSLQVEEIINCEGNLQEANNYSSEEDKQHDVEVRVVKLVALLDELESRYQQYFHRMDQVISLFEAVAGRGVAATYTALTIQAMSRHFSKLRDAILAQLHVSREPPPHREELQSLHRNPPQLRPADETMRQKREALQKLAIIQAQQAWRPLRGLPEDSVAVLRTWLFENFLHPYPDDTEKLMLASKTGLTRNQISNWFINARVRIWKPMIEEMYREEFAEDTGNLSTSS
ncbi:BEL1-like homeodomain protein [Musa troglodytarum]|uniref:BEL1-like homeodomain protein n=1 Tax=Musa troglodytarum TaxID=320322 RepID=A0A9E7K841_9LILI|nr:BEL1-like homeodomain protein [Musa troglodytarum]